MNQRLDRIDGVAPFLRQPVLRLFEQCEQKLSRKLLLVHGWRSVQEQALLYQKGRAMNRETGDWEIVEPTAVVTRAKPGATAHNVITVKGERAAVAVDVIPFDSMGMPDWEVSMDFWERLWGLAWKCGLDPLGDRIGDYLQGDLGHLQEPGWKLKLEGLGLLLPVADVARLA